MSADAAASYPASCLRWWVAAVACAVALTMVQCRSAEQRARISEAQSEIRLELAGGSAEAPLPEDPVVSDQAMPGVAAAETVTTTEMIEDESTGGAQAAPLSESHDVGPKPVEIYGQPRALVLRYPRRQIWEVSRFHETPQWLVAISPQVPAHRHWGDLLAQQLEPALYRASKVLVQAGDDSSTRRWDEQIDRGLRYFCDGTIEQLVQQDKSNWTVTVAYRVHRKVALGRPLELFQAERLDVVHMASGGAALTATDLEAMLADVARRIAERVVGQVAQMTRSSWP